MILLLHDPRWQADVRRYHAWCQPFLIPAEAWNRIQTVQLSKRKVGTTRRGQCLDSEGVSVGQPRKRNVEPSALAIRPEKIRLIYDGLRREPVVSNVNKRSMRSEIQEPKDIELMLSYLHRPSS